MTISGYDRRTGEPTSTPTVEDHTELADPTAWPAGLPGEPCWVAWPQSLTVAHKLDEWHPSMLLVETIIPWTTEWLAHYELWKRTHQWYGDGDASDAEPPSADPPPIGAPVTSRNERRWEARATSRRAWRGRHVAGGGSSRPRDAPSGQARDR
jgi:hypothetical protein